MPADAPYSLNAWLLTHHTLSAFTMTLQSFGASAVTHVYITRTEHICADHLCHKHRRAGHMSPCRSSTKPAIHRTTCVPVRIKRCSAHKLLLQKLTIKHMVHTSGDADHQPHVHAVWQTNMQQPIAAPRPKSTRADAGPHLAFLP